MTKTDLYCPKCGIAAVEVDEAREDYYIGAPHFCSSCDHYFHITGPYPYSPITDPSTGVVVGIFQKRLLAQSMKPSVFRRMESLKDKSKP